MLVFYSLIALFIAWIWVDYFRLIDIYDRDKLLYFVVSFVLGGVSVLLVFGINKILPPEFFPALSGGFFHDFAYSVVKIGAIEELAKLVPFVIVYYTFRSQFTEPIDYLAYICTSALGFSAVENCMYFYQYGPEVINGRAILSTVGHMFDTAIIAYGIIRYKFHPEKPSLVSVIFFFFLAAMAHGFYDFWLIYEGIQHGGFLITLLYFLVTISLFAIILNNAINNSSFFSYKKVVDSHKVTNRLLSYYLIVFASQFLLVAFSKSVEVAMGNLFVSLITAGFIVIVTCVRLSRFKLIKGRWYPLKPELPFELSPGDPLGVSSSQFHVQIKGDPYNEIFISKHYQEYFYLKPLSRRKNYLARKRLAYVEEKLFFKGDVSVYRVRVYESDAESDYEIMLLRTKTHGVSMQNKTNPIVAMLKFDPESDWDLSQMLMKDFRFLGWGVMVAIPVEETLSPITAVKAPRLV